MPFFILALFLLLKISLAHKEAAAVTITVTRTETIRVLPSSSASSPIFPTTTVPTDGSVTPITSGGIAIIITYPGSLSHATSPPETSGSSIEGATTTSFSLQGYYEGSASSIGNGDGTGTAGLSPTLSKAAEDRESGTPSDRSTPSRESPSLSNRQVVRIGSSLPGASIFTYISPAQVLAPPGIPTTDGEANVQNEQALAPPGIPLQDSQADTPIDQHVALPGIPLQDSQAHTPAEEGGAPPDVPPQHDSSTPSYPGVPVDQPPTPRHVPIADSERKVVRNSGVLPSFDEVKGDYSTAALSRYTVPAPLTLLKRWWKNHPFYPEAHKPASRPARSDEHKIGMMWEGSDHQAVDDQNEGIWAGNDEKRTTSQGIVPSEQVDPTPTSTSPTTAIQAPEATSTIPIELNKGGGKGDKDGIGGSSAAILRYALPQPFSLFRRWLSIPSPYQQRKRSFELTSTTADSIPTPTVAIRDSGNPPLQPWVPPAHNNMTSAAIGQNPRRWIKRLLPPSPQPRQIHRVVDLPRATTPNIPIPTVAIRDSGLPPFPIWSPPPRNFTSAAIPRARVPVPVGWLKRSRSTAHPPNEESRDWSKRRCQFPGQPCPSNAEEEEEQAEAEQKQLRDNESRDLSKRRCRFPGQPCPSNAQEEEEEEEEEEE